MPRYGIYGLIWLLLNGCLFSNQEKSKPPAAEQSLARIKTVYGDIIIKFYTDKAPITSQRIIHLVRSGFYNGLPFHRVVPNFIIQTGDPTQTGEGGSGQNIPLEPNQITHSRGTVSMARDESDPNSADSQFFICLQADQSLNGRYTAFAQVVRGDEILDKIKQGDKIITMTME